MQDDEKHTFEYRIDSDSLNESSYDWSKILGLLCGEICLVLLDSEGREKYIKNEKYRSKVINFIRAETSFNRHENVYSLCISLSKKDIQNL